VSLCYRRPHSKADVFSKDSIHTSNPFTNLSNVVSGLTTIGHLDVYSLSRESLQRMLPESASRDSPAGNSTPPVRPPPDTRQFQYRFSMTYIRSLPEGQRPVEREIFGMPFFSPCLISADRKDHSLHWHWHNGKLLVLSVQIAKISSYVEQGMRVRHGVLGRKS